MVFARWTALRETRKLLGAVGRWLDEEAAAEPPGIRELVDERLPAAMARLAPHAATPAGELDLAVAWALGWARWYRFVLRYPDGVAGIEEELELAVDAFRELWRQDHRDIPQWLVALYDPEPEPVADQAELLMLVCCAEALFERASRADDAEPIRAAALLLARRADRACAALEPADPLRAALASVLIDGYHQTEEEPLLDTALHHARLAAPPRPGDDPDRLFVVSVLGRALTSAGCFRADDRALEEALGLLRPAVAGAGGHPDAGRAACVLGWAVTVLSERADFTSPGLLPEIRGLIELIPPDAPGAEPVLLSLRVTQIAELVSLRDPAAMPELRAAAQDVRARAGTAEPDAALAELLAACAVHLFVLAWSHAPEFRDDAIAMTRQAQRIAAATPLPPGASAGLAFALVKLSDHVDDGQAPAAAIGFARDALARTPQGHPDLLRRKAILAWALTGQAGAEGEGPAEAVRLLRDDLADPDPGRPGLTVAACAYIQAHTVSCGRRRGTETVSVVAELYRVLRFIPEHTRDHDGLLMDVLTLEAPHLGALGDVTGLRALRARLRGPLERAGRSTPLHDWFSLFDRYLSALEHIVHGAPIPAAELAEYLRAYEEAAGLPGDWRGPQLNMLAVAALSQVELTGDLPLLGKVVTLLETETGERPPPGDPLQAALGSAYLMRFRAEGTPADLDLAVRLLRERLDAAGDSAFDRNYAASELAQALKERYLSTGDEDAYGEAIALLRGTAEDPDAILSSRLFDGWEAGRLAAHAGRWADAAELLDHRVELTARLAWRGLDPTDRERNLAAQWDRADGVRLTATGSGPAGDAAAAALRVGNPVRAVELLEAGRTVLAGPALDVRGEAARVRAALPAEAARLDALDAELHRAAPERRRELAAEWDALVELIRRRPGFDEFLRPPRFDALRPAPGQTVIMLNASDLGSAALIVTAAGVRTVPLPGLSAAEARRRAEAFLAAVDERTRAARRRPAIEAVTAVLDWLWRTVAAPVLDSLEPGTGHVHWYPAGMLGLLPVHAAAASPAEPGGSVLDRVVSSYAISLRTLRLATALPEPPETARSQLVVAMPETPGLAPLPGAAREADLIAAAGRHAAVYSGDAATRAAVLDALPRHAWVHFACHAAQDLRDPGRSRLYLQDHPLTALDISALVPVHGRLAYLSACETARGGARLADEALHLGGALHLAGYQRVIATLWQISDGFAAALAARVYPRLKAGGPLDPERAAQALHDSVRELRARYPADPTLWGAYVHIGP